MVHRAVFHRVREKLAGERALITGGGSELGGAVAELFAREGADVCISCSPDEVGAAEETRDAIERAAGRPCLIAPGDLEDPAFCRELVMLAVDELGGLDILVANAPSPMRLPGDRMTADGLEHAFRASLFAYVHLAQAAIPHLSLGSAIIATAPVAPELADYAACAAAIDEYTKVLARQLADRGIRINAIAAHADRADAAPACLFLASPADASDITGIVLPIGT
ncbi:MAG TPA: SDR family oxidoreductase [Kofleriaceae bacterium]|nr:SDR family oxidoreductase [Kofleriaceae bacterium]